MLFILNKSHEVVGSLNSNGDLSRITTYFDDKYVQDLGTGAETFEFSTMADTEQAQHLVAGNFIAFKEDGEFKLFNIIQIEEVHEEVFTKTVYCEMAGIELINEIIRPMKILNSSLRKFLTTILEGTEWQLGKLDAGFTQVFDFESTDYKSAYELIQEYAVGIYGAEISYRVEIEHGIIVGKYIDCYKQRGKVDGFRFAYGSNLTSVTRTVDMSNLATALIGVGKSGITFKEVDTGDKPYGQDFVVNEDAFKQWNINGSHIFGVHKEETESPQELLRLTRNALIERSNPQIKYEMKVELLGREVKIGDTVNVVDHEFNPPLYLSARVNQLTKSKTNPYDDEVVLANFKELRSNITEEMRALASQLEGYVDSQFPIGSSQIQNGAVGKEQFSKTYHTEIVADAVYASLVETEELIAGKANIGDLEVVNARIENLQADKADITELNAQKAEIEELIAQKADIESLKAITANIETLYTDKANVTDLNALNATVNNLKAEKADITDLNATNATINQLKVDKADINSLNALEIKVNTIDASKANISDLNATNATIGHLQASKADIAELNAVKGNIQILESEVADIEHILAGNITADNIASGTITAGSGIIANGAIGNAEISSVDAGKISAGTVDTSKVTIQGSNGHLRIKGNRLQVFNGTGSQAKERVSVGDVNGDGTIYGLRVRGADGTTILLDENGVTSEGITDGSITNEKISDNAEIDGAKLNINSVVSKINEDGTEVIKGTKIEVDGTSLTTKLSNMTIKQDEDSERISQAQTQITANENALKLKVDNQTYQTDKQGTQTTLDKHTSEINALQGEVSLKVDRTGVESIIDEVSGELIDSKIDTAKAEIKLTTDAITQNITNLSNTVSNKADSSTVSTINSKVAQLDTTLSGISGKVSNVEKTVTNLGNSVEGVEGEIETLKNDVASLEVTTSGISQKVSSVESTTATLNTKVNTANTNATNALNKATSAESTANSVNSQVNANKNNISNLTTTVNTTNSKVASLETNLNGITSRVSSVETKTNTIDGKVTAQETRLANAESKITSSAIINTVSSTIDSKVNAGISNIKLGGRNYIYYGKGDVKKGFFTNFNKVDDGYGEHTLTSQKTYSNVAIGSGFLLGCRDYEVGKQITFSYEIMYTEWDFPTGTNRSEFWIGQRYSGGTTESSEGAWTSVTKHNLPEVGKNGCELNKWFKVEKVLTIPKQAHSSISGASSIQFYNSNADVSASVTFRLRNVKIEYGNKATDWTPSPEETENIISDTEKLLNENIDNAISDAQKSILQNVSDNYATSEKLNILSQTVSSNMTQTNNNINMQFETATNYTKEVDGKLQEFQNTVGTHIRFSTNGIDLGKTNSPFTATLDNTQLAFKQDGSTVAYISNNKMYITQAEIKETLRIGTSANGFFSWVQGSKGNLSLKWSDK